MALVGDRGARRAVRGRVGKYIVYTSRSDTGGGWDIQAVLVAGDKKPIPIVKTQFSEMWATFSPDGKYIAYQSNESGRHEIYVHEFPEARNKWQISSEGGVEPYWRGDGRELFYRLATSVMSVAVQIGSTLTAGTPAPLFQTRFGMSNVRGRAQLDHSAEAALIPDR